MSAHDPLGACVPGSCELSDMGAGNQTSSGGTVCALNHDLSGPTTGGVGFMSWVLSTPKVWLVDLGLEVTRVSKETSESVALN